MITIVYLIIRIDGHVRLTKSRIKLGPGEVSVPIRIKFPDSWGRQLTGLDVVLPEPQLEVAAQEPVPYTTTIAAWPPVEDDHPAENHPMEYPPGENP